MASEQEQTGGSDRVWLILVLCLALFVRLLFLVASDFSIDADEAIVGLMARHFNSGRPWSIFYYGQSYMGSLEPTLTALVFRIVGATPDSLKIVPTIFSIWFVLLVWIFARTVSDLRAARWASLLAAVPPVAFIEWSTKARGGFIELVVLGTLGLILAARILKMRSAPPVLKVFLLGFVLGVAWWVNNQAIFYIAAIGLGLAMFGLRNFRAVTNLRFLISGAVGFFLGGAPFWWANLTSNPRWASFNQLSGRATPGEALDHFVHIFTESLPILLGARPFWSYRDNFPFAAPLALLLWAMAIWFALVKRRGQGGSNARSLLSIFLVTTPLIFSLSAFGWLTQAPRYLLPLYSALFVVAGMGISNLAATGKRLAGFSMGVLFVVLHLISNYGAGMIIPGQPFVALGERVALNQEPLYRFLKSEGYHHIFTNYWIGYRVAFETGENVVFSIYGEPKTRRIPWYEENGERISSPYVLVPSQAVSLTHALLEQGYQFRTTKVGEYIVLDQLTPINGPIEPISLRPEQLSVPSRPEWRNRLVDGDDATRWGSGMPQHPGMSIVVELDEPMTLSAVQLIQGFWPQDIAQKLRIDLESEGAPTCTVFDGVVEDAFVAVDGIFQVNFSAHQAKRVRITQEGTHPIFDWSVAELKLFTPANEDLDPPGVAPKTVEPKGVGPKAAGQKQNIRIGKTGTR